MNKKIVITSLILSSSLLLVVACGPTGGAKKRANTRITLNNVTEDREVQTLQEKKEESQATVNALLAQDKNNKLSEDDKRKLTEAQEHLDTLSEDDVAEVIVVTAEENEANLESDKEEEQVVAEKKEEINEMLDQVEELTTEVSVSIAEEIISSAVRPDDSKGMSLRKGTDDKQHVFLEHVVEDHTAKVLLKDLMNGPVKVKFIDSNGQTNERYSAKMNCLSDVRDENSCDKVSIYTAYSETTDRKYHNYKILVKHPANNYYSLELDSSDGVSLFDELNKEILEEAQQ